MKFCIGAAVPMLVAVTPAYAQAPTAAVLDRLLAEFVVAFNAKDAAKVASFYAEDGVLMPPGAPLIKGRTAIEAVLRKQFEQSGVLKLSSFASEVVGNRAFAAGTFTVTVSRGVAVPERILQGTVRPGVGTASQVVAAKFLTVFKQVGNDWKIAYDMQNADER